MIKKLWKVVAGPFYVIGSLCSITSIAVLCFNDKNAAIIALGVFCLGLLLFLIGIFKVLNRFLEKENNNHKCISSFIQYSTDDNENITVETYKIIQVKCSLIQEYDAGFKWSGKETPDISSELQDFKIIKRANNSAEYDYAVLVFRKPVLFNETTVVHFKTNSNDVNKISLPYIEIPIRQPIEFVQICISLGYKDQNFNKTAKISKRLLTNENQILQEHQNFDSIAFDKIHKQYIYRLINPKVGYSYKISWDR